MYYDIAFPVDGGTPERSFLVKVRLVLAQKHYCKNGKASRLRPNSGAEFVFERMPLYIQKRYRFEFTPVPMPNPTTRPDTIASTGYSDALACALSLQQKSFNTNSKLLLFSGSFLWVEKNSRQKLLMERVTAEDQQAAHKSLYNKWKVAEKANAAALFLHEKDAQLLHQHYGIRCLRLSTSITSKIKKAQRPLLVSYKANQLSLLKKTINKKNNVIFRLFAYMFILYMGITIYSSIYYIYKGKNPRRLEYENLISKVSWKKIAKRTWEKEIKIKLKSMVSNVPFLRKKLQAEDWKEQFIAIYILGELKEKSMTVEIIAAGQNRYLWKEAIIALRKISPKVQDLLFFANHENVIVRKIVAEVAPYIQIETVDVNLLLQHLQNKTSLSTILTIIANNGQKSQKLLTELLPLLAKDNQHKKLAAEAICSLGECAIEPLYTYLRNPKYNRKMILKILEILSLKHSISSNIILQYSHKEISATAPTLVRNMDSEKQKTRIAALLALYRTENDLAVIKELVQQPNPSSEMLNHIAKQNQKFTDFFYFVVKNSPVPHLYLEKYIKFHSPKSEEVIPLFQQLLHHKSPLVHSFLLQKLDEMNVSIQVFIDYLSTQASLDDWQGIEKAICILARRKNQEANIILSKIAKGPYQWHQRAMARIAMQTGS